jgi:hypothetical protein
MGLIGRILDSFKGTAGEPAAKVEIYKGDNANARIFNPPGDDSRPLDGDICYTEDSEDTEGGKDIIGFIDQKNEPVSEKGERRLYSRDANGNIVAKIHLKKDGTVLIEAVKLSLGDGTNEFLSEAIKGLKENKKLVGSTLLAGSVDSPGVASTGTNSLILTGLASMESALDAIITALETIQV